MSDFEFRVDKSRRLYHRLTKVDDETRKAVDKITRKRLKLQVKSPTKTTQRKATSSGRRADLRGALNKGLKCQRPNFSHDFPGLLRKTRYTN